MHPDYRPDSTRPLPPRVDLFGNSSCDDNFVSEINHWTLNVPNGCAIQLGKVRIFVKKKKIAAPPPSNETLGGWIFGLGG